VLVVLVATVTDYRIGDVNDIDGGGGCGGDF